jgi:hypothetical protein
MQIVNKEMKSYEIIFSSLSTGNVEGYIQKGFNLYEALSSFMKSKISYKEIYEVKLYLKKETNAV